MADEQHAAFLGIDDETRGGDIACQRNRGVLDDADRITIFPQNLVDTLPAGPVHEATMHEHDRRTLLRHLCMARDRGRGGAKRERGQEYLLFHRRFLPDKRFLPPGIYRSTWAGERVFDRGSAVVTTAPRLS